MQASAEQHTKHLVPRKTERDSVKNAYKFAELAAYRLKKRLLIRAADLIFYVLIRLIGRTTRLTIEGWENWESATKDADIHDL